MLCSVRRLGHFVLYAGITVCIASLYYYERERHSLLLIKVTIRYKDPAKSFYL